MAQQASSLDLPITSTSSICLPRRPRRQKRPRRPKPSERALCRLCRPVAGGVTGAADLDGMSCASKERHRQRRSRGHHRDAVRTMIEVRSCHGASRSSGAPQATAQGARSSGPPRPCPPSLSLAGSPRSGQELPLSISDPCPHTPPTAGRQESGISPARRSDTVATTSRWGQWRDRPCLSGGPALKRLVPCQR